MTIISTSSLLCLRESDYIDGSHGINYQMLFFYAFLQIVTMNLPNTNMNAIPYSFQQDTLHGPFLSKVTVHNCIHINGTHFKHILFLFNLIQYNL